MSAELIESIKIISIWLALFLISYLMARLFGVRGNQMARARKVLEKLRFRNLYLQKEMRKKKKSQLKYVSRLNELTLLSRKAMAHLDVFIFDHKEYKHVYDPREQLFQLCQAYRQMLVSYTKEEIGIKEAIEALKVRNDETEALINILTKELERLDS